MYLKSLGFTPVQEQQVLDQLELLTQFTEAEERRRRWALYIGVASALFAAGRLGILAVPFVRQKRWRTGQ
jgi:hypothetical protein